MLNRIYYSMQAKNTKTSVCGLDNHATATATALLYIKTNALQSWIVLFIYGCMIKTCLLVCGSQGEGLLPASQMAQYILNSDDDPSPLQHLRHV
jgi:hypothetical protein